jgi:hypothetical protein
VLPAESSDPGLAAAGRDRSADRDEPVIVDTRNDEAYRRGSRRFALAALTATVTTAAVVAIVLAAFMLSGRPAASVPPTGSVPSETPREPTATTDLTARLAEVPPRGTAVGIGAVLQAVAGRPDGGLVAAGSRSAPGATGMPAAWWSEDRSAWQPAAVSIPPGATGGAMSGVVGVGGRLVGVGWVSLDGSGEQYASPTAWTSQDGREWRSAEVDGAGDGPQRMQDVVVAAGGLLAVGDSRVGDTAGDGAVWRSVDGLAWHRVAASGLGGFGVQSSDRVVRLADGSVLSVGQEPRGAGTFAHARRSGNADTWSDATTDLPVDAVVSGLTKLPDGGLLAVGSVPTGKGLRENRVWTGDAGGRHWVPERVATGRSTPDVEILGTSATGNGIVAVGVVTYGGSTRPAVWTLEVEQPR